MLTSHYADTFARDNLPPAEMLPDFINLDKLAYPDRLNAAVELVDGNVQRGRGDHPALVSPDAEWSYSELAEKINRIANLLVSEYGFQSGNRVLIRSPNSPMMTAIYFAVLKAGGVVVATMPLLRAKELDYILNKAKVSLAFCDHRLLDELAAAGSNAPTLKRTVAFGSADPESLDTAMLGAEPDFEAFDTASDDVCLIGFTSGTTGEPKGTMHFHRDLLAICDCYSAQVMKPDPEDRYIGSPPLAFTFGLGGLVLFPFRAGATAILLEAAPPDQLLKAIERFKATTCFTAPTAYRAMLAEPEMPDLSSLRKCVSAGEPLPKATWEQWYAATGLKLLDGLGSTEMLHVFVGSAGDDIVGGATGQAVPLYEAKVIGEDGEDLPPNTVGKLAVRGPTGCRYLDDPRQANYVQKGWNITGDAYLVDENGYFWFQARADDMIITAGYNIAGPEVEGALLTHPAVAECGVVGKPDEDRGQIVAAYVVLKPGFEASEAMTKSLQDFVKAEISPYKYPRAVEYHNTLPRTETGKLQRFKLREMAAGRG